MAKYTGVGFPTSNVKITDIRDTLGETTTNLSALCKSTKVNKWAMWKPLQSTKTTYLTEADRVAAHNGFLPQSLSVTLYGTSAPALTVKEWPAERPTSGPYRMSDFFDAEQKRGGYNPDALPPDKWWNDGKVSGFDFRMNTNSGLTSCTINSSTKVITTPQSLVFSRCGFRYDVPTADNINLGDSVNYHLPLSWCATLSSTARLGLLCKINNGNDMWGLFVAKAPLSTYKTSLSAASLLPDLMTNTWMCSLITSQFESTSKKLRDLTFIPCIADGVTLENTNYYNNGRYWYTNVRATSIYSVPSGTASVPFHLMSDDIIPINNELPLVSTKITGVGMVGVYAEDTGLTTGSPYYYPIRRLRIGVWVTELTTMTLTSATLSVSFDYTIRSGTSTVTRTASTTVTVNKSDVGSTGVILGTEVASGASASIVASSANLNVVKM